MPYLSRSYSVALGNLEDGLVIHRDVEAVPSRGMLFDLRRRHGGLRNWIRRVDDPGDVAMRTWR